MEHYIQDMFTSNYRRDPKREAIVDCSTGVHYTWEDLHNRAVQLARFCTNELGMKKGDRVAFLCPADVAMISMFHASLKTGLVIVCYNYRLHSAELAAMVNNEMPSVMFVVEESMKKAHDIQQITGVPFKTVALDGCSGADYTIDFVWDTEFDPIEVVELDPEDPAILVHTGGTTGLPKAAILSYRNILYNMIIEMKEFGLYKGDVIYTTMPFFHTGGWNCYSLIIMFVGGRLFLDKAFSVDTFYKLMETEHLTSFMGVEMMFKLVANDPRFQTCDLSSLRFVAAGGSPVEKSVMMAYMDRGIPFYNGFGSTESGANNAIISFNAPLEEVKAKYDCIGKPFVFNYFRIVDAEGNDVPQGMQGELLTRGGVLFSGYWNNPDATEKSMVDGWFRTGDMAYVDDEGEYHICGRIKHMYISGGENVYPPEIERVLQEFPGVREVHVMGVPNPAWGEVGKAYLVMDPDVALDRDAFDTFVKSRLSTIKRPHYVQAVPELPKTIMGKVDEKQLVKMYES